MGIKKKDNDNDLPPQHIGGSDSSENLDINYYGNSNQMLQNHYHDQEKKTNSQVKYSKKTRMVIILLNKIIILTKNQMVDLVAYRFYYYIDNNTL